MSAYSNRLLSLIAHTVGCLSLWNGSPAQAADIRLADLPLVHSNEARYRR